MSAQPPPSPAVTLRGRTYRAIAAGILASIATCIAVGCGRDEPHGSDNAPKELVKSPQDQSVTPPDVVYAIWRTPTAPRDSLTLAEILRGDELPASGVRVFDSLEKWLGCTAEVLVFRGGGRRAHGGLTGSRNWPLLKKRRVLAIGIETGLLVRGLGIGPRMDDYCQPRDPVRIRVSHTRFAPEGLRGQTMRITDSTVVSARELQLAIQGLRTDLVDPDMGEALALVENGPEAAPIARRGPFVLVAVGLDAGQWSQPFQDLIRGVAAELRRVPTD